MSVHLFDRSIDWFIDWLLFSYKGTFRDVIIRSIWKFLHKYQIQYHGSKKQYRDRGYLASLRKKIKFRGVETRLYHCRGALIAWLTRKCTARLYWEWRVEDEGSTPTRDFFSFFQNVCNDPKSNLLSSFSSMKRTESDLKWKGYDPCQTFINLVSFLLHIRYTVYFPLMKHLKIYFLIFGRCANVKKKKKNRACGSRTRVLHSPFSIKACCTLPSQSSNQCSAAMVKSGFHSPKLFFSVTPSSHGLDIVFSIRDIESSICVKIFRSIGLWHL